MTIHSQEEKKEKKERRKKKAGEKCHWLAGRLKAALLG